jgi:Raf kinase inhibitor-like YbhB/YbcL family protein
LGPQSSAAEVVISGGSWQSTLARSGAKPARVEAGFAAVLVAKLNLDKRKVDMLRTQISNVFSVLLLTIAVLAPVCVSTAQVKSPSQPKFVLSSPDAQLAAKVPEVYVANLFGCTGGNMSPPLQWTGAPAGAKSFVVTLFDPDEHGDPSGWWHWIVYNLPASVDKLPKGAGVERSAVLPPGTMQGRTDLGNDAYHGPCPDKGEPPHRYTFTVYALNVEKLDVPPDSSGAMVVSTAKEHSLGKAVFIAHYGR